MAEGCLSRIHCWSVSCPQPHTHPSSLCPPAGWAGSDHKSPSPKPERIRKPKLFPSRLVLLAPWRLNQELTIFIVMDKGEGCFKWKKRARVSWASWKKQITHAALLSLFNKYVVGTHLVLSTVDNRDVEMNRTRSLISRGSQEKAI